MWYNPTKLPARSFASWMLQMLSTRPASYSSSDSPKVGIGWGLGVRLRLRVESVESREIEVKKNIPHFTFSFLFLGSI